ILLLARKPHENVPARALPAPSGPLVELNGKEKGPAGRVVSPQPAGVATRAENGRKIRDLETTSWNATLANYREQIARYNFAGASEAIKNVQLSDASLKQRQKRADEKAQSLIVRVNTLIDDVNGAEFSWALID